MLKLEKSEMAIEKECGRGYRECVQYVLYSTLLLYRRYSIYSIQCTTVHLTVCVQYSSQRERILFTVY